MDVEQASSSELDQINSVALRLFAKRGYDSVSMQDVADAAELPLGDLLRRVNSKEYLILGESAQGPLWILDRFEQLPADQDVLQSLKQVFLERIALFPEEQMRLWRSAVLTAPAELQQLVALGVIERSALVGMVADRMGVDSAVDSSPSALVTMVVGAVAESYEVWLHGHSDRPLLDLMSESLAELPD
ncbi:MAG: TetR family transcriptional regulator [Marmoricola sp.]